MNILLTVKSSVHATLTLAGYVFTLNEMVHTKIHLGDEKGIIFL